MGSPEQQDICLQCGFCCDGTAFGFVPLGTDEEPSLAGLFAIERRRGEPRFLQPCPHLHECRCAIYERRPAACRKFNCRTLNDLAEGSIDRAEALSRIAAIRQAVADVRPHLRPGETLPGSRSRRTRLSKKQGAFDADEGAFMVKSVALSLLVERYLRTDDWPVFEDGDE